MTIRSSDHDPTRFVALFAEILSIISRSTSQRSKLVIFYWDRQQLYRLHCCMLCFTLKQSTTTTAIVAQFHVLVLFLSNAVDNN